jgi:hypothetical protein
MLCADQKKLTRNRSYLWIRAAVNAGVFGWIMPDGRDCADVVEDVFRWPDLMVIEKGRWDANERQLHIAGTFDEAACTEEKETRQRGQVRGADKEIYYPSGHSNTHWLPVQVPMENRCELMASVRAR